MSPRAAFTRSILNGKRVGDDYYNPGLTQYNITHMYQTYDVTGMIKAGDNAMGAMLGEGWWSGLLSFGDIWNHFGDRQSLLAKLVVTYKDGSSDTVVTNDPDVEVLRRRPAGLQQPGFRRNLRCRQGARRGRLDHRRL